MINNTTLFLGKITDYGLHYFKQTCNRSGEESVSAYKLLWTAPEILRGTNKSSKEGDVYSFGIITQEIVLEDAPYCWNNTELDNEEIVLRVKKQASPPYRPYLKSNGTTLKKKLFKEQIFAYTKPGPKMSI